MGQKSVLITGTSKGGIGEALAKAFHKAGLRVFATARNLEKVQHLARDGITLLPLDVVDPMSIQNAVEKVKVATGGTLDILVNNSGGGYTVPLLDSDASVAKKTFDVNVFSLVSMVQEFSPLLIASKGTIINIGSVLGYTPFPWSGYYNASKAAANILTDQMRLELSPWGIKVILVVAGGVRTKFFQNLPAKPQLPDGSLYLSARSEVEHVMSGEELEKAAMDVDEFAEGVVNNALKSSPKKHQWIGGGASNIWFAVTFGWSTVWDTILPRMVKLTTVIAKIQAGKT